MSNSADSSCDVLTGLANHFGTDKGSQYFDAHCYTSFYSSLFDRLRHRAFTFIELGISRGAQDCETAKGRVITAIPSIEMWLRYFPKATIVGFDLSELAPCLHTRDRFRFVNGDVGSVVDLAKLKTLPSVRIIIDDASHASFHQQKAFAHLFPLLDDGGFYAIEDLHWKPSRYERSLPPCMDTAKLFSGFLSTGSLEMLDCVVANSSSLATQMGTIYCFPADRPADSAMLIVIQKRLRALHVTGSE
jgi:hypothetical protein